MNVATRKTAPLHRYLSLREVATDRLWRADDVPVAVLEVRPVGLDLAADSARNGLLGGFAMFLNSLEHPVQFLVRLTPADFTEYAERLRSAVPQDLPPDLNDLAASLQRMLTGLHDRAGVLDRRFYLLVPGKTARRGTGRNSDALDDRVGQVMASLDRIGLRSVWLDGPALRAFWHAALAGTTTIRLPAASDPVLSLNVDARAIAVNGFATKGLVLEQWPRNLYTGWLTGLLTLGIPLDLSIHVAPEDAATSARRLEWKRIQMESARSFALKRGKNTSPEEDLALEDLNRLRDEVQRGRERLFLTALAVSAHAASAAELERHTRRVQSYVAGSLGRLTAPALQQRAVHQATLPLARNPAGAWKRVDTSSLVCLFPFAPADLDTRRGIPFGMDVQAGCPVILDPFQEASYLNANTIVVAQSGAGKSYAVKLLTLRALLRGVTHYVIDPEGEYSPLAEAAGGKVLRPGTPGQGLNPFTLAGTDEAAVAHKVGALRRLLEVMLGERFSPEQRADLDAMLTDYYGSAPAHASFEDFYAFLKDRNTHSTGSEPALSLPKGQGFAVALRPFADGSLRFLLGASGDLEHEESRLTVFDLSHLDPDLRPAVAHLCAETVWSLAVREPKQRVLVIDEAWALLQHPEGAAFLSGMAKRARKHRLGVTAITQDAQDFLEGDTDRAIAGHSGKTLVQNAAFKLLLRQDPAAMGVVAQAFNLTPSEQAWLLTCGRGEGLLSTPQGRVLLRIESTPEEHRLLAKATIAPLQETQ